jgi:hypothetical protein
LPTGSLPCVLHLDKDFELIAAMTGQPMERLDGGADE